MRAKSGRNWLGVIAIASYCLGVSLRMAYVWRAHAPRQVVFSDALSIAGLAERFREPNATQSFADTVWPPGQAAFVALALHADESLGVAADFQLLLSCLVPILIGHTTSVVFGRSAGALALAFASLHFGFIHYAGYFLSEQWAQFSVTLAIWATAVMLGMPSRRWCLAAGFVSGLAWGLATTFRSNAFAVAVLVGCAILPWLVKRAERAKLVGLAVGVIGFVLVVAPMSQRCSGLVGHFCAGASNPAMNIALGHVGDNLSARFVPRPGALDSEPSRWSPPIRAQHRLAGVETIPVSMYDTSALLGWVAHRFRERPLGFVIECVGNAFDLFGTDSWPDYSGDVPRRWTIVAKQAFLLAVVVPGLFACFLVIRDLVRRRSVALAHFFLFAVVVAVTLVAFGSMGEARYRIPFDGAFIALAAAVYVRTRDEHARLGVGARFSLVAAGVGALTSAALVSAVAHPSVALAARLGSSRQSEPRSVALTVPASRFSEPKQPGTELDAEGNVAIVCATSCPEVRVSFERPVKASRLELSLDHNDRYQITFYRSGEPIAHVRAGVAHADVNTLFVQRGLIRETVDVPPSARSTDFDEVGIWPQYGDGWYGFGHVRLDPDRVTP